MGGTASHGSSGGPDCLEPESFADLPGWMEDDHLAAFLAFRRSAVQSLARPYRSGGLGPDFGSFAHAYEAARAGGILDRGAARAFFEDYFTPCRVGPDEGQGFVTGYYEPELAASPLRTETFGVPLYRRPPDLVAVDETSRPADLDPCHAFGRRTESGIVEYHDRAEIEGGALAGKGLELAWLAERVDAFFVHVQGAARLRMTDGQVMRITYDGKSGHPFTGPGRVLAGMGEIPRREVTMQSIREWFRHNPLRIDEILHRNRSFIFFRETPAGDAGKGPVAAAKVQLEPGRSLAVDRLFHTFGTPIFVEAPSLMAVDGRPFRRLMVAQDTGSAIVGPARGDIFIGTGDAAGEIAGVIRNAAHFHLLVPLAFARRLT